MEEEHLQFKSKGKNQQGNELFIVINTNTGHELGKVWFYLPEMRWMWEQYDGVLMSSECLGEVRAFILKKDNGLEKTYADVRKS